MLNRFHEMLYTKWWKHGKSEFADFPYCIAHVMILVILQVIAATFPNYGNSLYLRLICLAQCDITQKVPTRELVIPFN